MHMIACNNNNMHNLSLHLLLSGYTLLLLYAYLAACVCCNHMHLLTEHCVSNWSRSASTRKGCLTSDSALIVKSNWESSSTLVLPAPVAPIGSASNVAWYPKIPHLPFSVLCVWRNGKCTKVLRRYNMPGLPLSPSLYRVLDIQAADYTSIPSSNFSPSPPFGSQLVMMSLEATGQPSHMCTPVCRWTPFQEKRCYGKSTVFCNSLPYSICW